jgi:hypothetical protein
MSGNRILLLFSNCTQLDIQTISFIFSTFYLFFAFSELPSVGSNHNCEIRIVPLKMRHLLTVIILNVVYTECPGGLKTNEQECMSLESLSILV